MRRHLILLSLFPVFAGLQPAQARTVRKIAMVDASVKYQTMDGFGVNFNPALWDGGKQKQAIDLLVDNLGAVLFRFDAFGNADWLNPSRQQGDGKWPAPYLDSVYTSPVWGNAWEAFRYLNAKGIQPYFSVSGKVPQAWNEPGTKVLANFDAYSEMIATMLDWARNREHLGFALLDPYNETDADGSREGPAIPAKHRAKALASMVAKLKEHKLDQVKLVLFSDATPAKDKLAPVLADSSFAPYVYAFSGHSYGNGDEGEGSWYWSNSQMGSIRDALGKTPYRDAHVWLNEFGDLDQSNEIEFEFAWRSVRRLLLELRSGTQSCQFWDAHDNFHKHDTAWSTYGLLHVDTVHMGFTPKPRFYALKQVYRFVRPGFTRVDISGPKTMKYDVYDQWRSGLKNIKLYAFVSPDGKQLSITGSNLVEADVALEISLKGLGSLDNAKVYTYVTTRTKDFALANKGEVKGNAITATIPERSIFTISTIEAK